MVRGYRRSSLGALTNVQLIGPQGTRFLDLVPAPVRFLLAPFDVRVDRPARRPRGRIGLRRGKVDFGRKHERRALAIINVRAARSQPQTIENIVDYLPVETLLVVLGNRPGNVPGGQQDGPEKAAGSGAQETPHLKSSQPRTQPIAGDIPKPVECVAPLFRSP